MLHGVEGFQELQSLLNLAREHQYYILLDAPEIFSVEAAKQVAESMLGDPANFNCDGIVISAYLGTDVIKPFLPYCKKAKKSVFVVARTANKSASELQDLLTGSRLVHAAAADHVNRCGVGTEGKCGYKQLGLLVAANAADSIRSLRSKYPDVFFLVDGYDYSGANAKNCSCAFDKYGHGAVVCAGSSITGAWSSAENGEFEYDKQAVFAIDRMKKNLSRYIQVL
jgi:orotidine-5'-phosphate decarboxylase